MPNLEYKNKTHHISLRISVSGLLYAFKTQPNFKIMALFSIIVILLSFFLKISQIEFLIIIWTIFLVFITEMINTSIESVTDLVTQEWNQNAKIAKDVSSGMTLMSVIGSVIIGIIIFSPKLLNLL